MSYISSMPREQLMLPISIDDYVCSDNIVRFIDVFVDKVSCAYPELFLHKNKSLEGRPGYNPASLCKLLLYGYMNYISSSRKLETESKRNLEVIWLMNNLHPDHWTISNFRKENKSAIKRVTLDFRLFLKQSGYISVNSVSTDGTKIKAYASRDTISMKLIDKKLSQLEQEIERYFNRLDETDAIEDEQSELLSSSQELKSQIDSLQKQVYSLKSDKALLEALGRNSLAPADHEARIMKTKDGFLPAYNVQTTVDNASHFITSCQVTDRENDYHSLEENINTLHNELGILPEQVLADAGYANEKQIRDLEAQGLECIVAFPQETELKKTQRENGISFRYDDKRDCFICSQSTVLLLAQKKCKKKNQYYSRYQAKDCSWCPKKQLCTSSKTGRTVFRRLDGEWLEAYREKMKTSDFKEKFKPRKCVVEHPFGTMKYLMGQIPILLRGIKKVQIEMDLYATAYNLKHLSKIEKVPVLLEKLAQWKPVLAAQQFLSSFFYKTAVISIFR